MNRIGLVGIGGNWRDDDENRSDKARNERGQAMEETHLFKGQCAHGANTQRNDSRISRSVL